MSWIDQVMGVLIYLWSTLHTKYPLMGFFIACTIALLKSFHQTKKFDFIGSILCGCIAAMIITSTSAINSVLTHFSVYVIDSSAYSFVAGTIGYYGAYNTMEFVAKQFNRFTGVKNNANDTKGL